METPITPFTPTTGVWNAHTGTWSMPSTQLSGALSNTALLCASLSCGLTPHTLEVCSSCDMTARLSALVVFINFDAMADANLRNFRALCIFTASSVGAVVMHVTLIYDAAFCSGGVAHGFRGGRGGLHARPAGASGARRIAAAAEECDALTTCSLCSPAQRCDL